MPPVNAPVLTAGVIAVSVAVAAAIAVYESPELQRMAQDLRRRIAIALHSFGDSISPQERANLFNRPEDAEGFLQSRGLGAGHEPGVVADDETRRRQRDELMYWNTLLEEKKEKERRERGEEFTEKADASRPRTSTRGSSFDDFMQQDGNAEKGTYVFQTGAEPQHNAGNLVRRRGEGARGLNQSAVYTNPFADEHGIDEHVELENSLMDPEKDELMSDIYSTSDCYKEQERLRTGTLSSPAASLEISMDASMPGLIDGSAPPHEQPEPRQPTTPIPEQQLGQDEYMTAGQEDRQDAFSSIQAWANSASNPSFYSPLPVSPPAPISEPELVSDHSGGGLTPTDSISLIGSGDDVGEDAVSASSGNRARYYDVMSDDEGMMTPASWTEVGSVVSESDNGAVHA